MAKPLNYYCNGVIIDALVETYGSQLQGLTRQQKLFLMTYIAGNLCAEATGEDDALTKPEITGLAGLLNTGLTVDEKESLLVALAHQVRETTQSDPTPPAGSDGMFTQDMLDALIEGLNL